jgi:hypothetical protein
MVLLKSFLLTIDAHPWDANNSAGLRMAYGLNVPVSAIEFMTYIASYLWARVLVLLRDVQNVAKVINK